MAYRVLNSILLALFLVTALPLRADETADAKAILTVSGVHTGLCIHLGCGRVETPGLAAVLAEGGALLVHGIALDDAALARARKAIESRGVAGFAMVEQIALKPLPYVQNLVNLAVVEDFAALEKLGLSKADVLEVVAPNGVLCIKEGGTWTKTVKARPVEMDDWTHPRHGPDGNMVSSDKALKFPLGFRWVDGLPVNVNRWAACRAWVIAGGRCFTLSSNEMENIGQKTKEHYLAARDAFNGMPLWKINCGTTDDGAFLTYENAGALVADDHRAYAVLKDKAIGVDAATGKIAATFATKFPPARLLLSNNVLVASCWEARDISKAGFNKNSLWATWVAKSNTGSVEAFDATTGQSKWSLPVPAETIVAADNIAYLLTQTGNPPTERNVVAVDLQSGKELWRVPHSKFGTDVDLDLNCAGTGFVVAGRRISKSFVVLSAKDGSVLWQSKTSSNWTPLVYNTLWSGNKKYNPMTGEVTGTLASGFGDQGCTPSLIVNNYITHTRGCGYTELPESEGAGGKATNFNYAAARGACMEGMVPANGMLYTAQNNCRCAPGQVYGFLAVGPSGEWPKAEFSAKRVVEKGAAFGAISANGQSPGIGEWPMYRHDAERSGANAVQIPESLKALWKVQALKPPEGAIAEMWKPRLSSCLSAPVSADGKVFASATDTGTVLALDAANGKTIWTVPLSARLDSPPTIYHGLCLIGCHDGWVYALQESDGALVWRARVAPIERRMVAFGAVESVWPAVGTVLIQDGVAYANAGRTSESDGGVAVLAFDPMTGAQIWGTAIGPGPLRQSDLLCVRDGAIAWHHVRLDAKSGAALPPATPPKDYSQGGILDGTWTIAGTRRSGNAFTMGKVTTNLMAWDSKRFASNKGIALRETGANQFGVPTPGGCQIEAIAMAENAVVFAGRMKDAQTSKPKGVLFVVSLTDGKKLAEFPLDAPPSYDGVIVSRDKVYVSLQDGTVACYGK